MGEQNANSTITLRMTRMARRRIAGQVSSEDIQRLLQALSSAASAADIATRGPDAVAGGVYGMGVPARTPREIDHMRVHVLPSVGEISKAIITEVVTRNWPVSYSVADGKHWVVEFVTMRDETMGGGAIETAVTWINPQPRHERPLPTHD